MCIRDSLRKIANEQDPLPTGFVQRSRAGYHTAIATELEPNITVTWPLGHMITESDVPDYAELQRHSGHRESSMHAEAAEAKSVTRMKPGSGATDALLGQQDLVGLSSAVLKWAEAFATRSAPPKRFLPPFGIGTPEAESLKQDVRKYVARVRKTSINELLLNFGARFNEIFWRKKKAKQGSWKAWLQTIHGIELDLKASPYPAIACSCASDMYAFLDTLSPVPVAEKDTHNASESWGHAQRSLEKEVRNCLSRNGPTSIDKMQKDFGDRYRAVHPPPWSLRRWLSGLSGVECSLMQLSGQDNADHGMNTDRASKQCYTSTLVLVFNESRVHSTSSECQHKRKRTKSKHKRSRCHNRSRSHRAHANSRAIRPAVLNGLLVQSSAERPAERPAAAQAVSPVAAVAPKQRQWWHQSEQWRQQGHQNVEKPPEEKQQQSKEDKETPSGFSLCREQWVEESTQGRSGEDAEKQEKMDDTAYKATGETVPRDTKQHQWHQRQWCCLLYTSDACRRYSLCRSRWSPYH